MPEERKILPFAVSVLESTFSEYTVELRSNRFEDKIPVLIYPSPNSFKQTNVTLDIIDEFTGGFTEVMKNRVVVPFNGSYSDFQHVLRHELVHVFQFHIFYKGIRTYHVPPFTMSIPLWVMEGMAEYFSWGGWSPDAEMFMRDLVLNDKVIPIDELEYYGGWIIYKEGQAIFCFLRDVYGPEKTREFIYQLKMNGSVDKAFKKVTGKTAAELNEAFSFYLKKKFYPSVDEFSFPPSDRELTRGKNAGFLNFGVLSPDGGKVALISDRSGYTDIYLISTFDGKIIKKLIQGQKSPSFENLHLVRPGLNFSHDGKLLLFVANRGGYDAIYAYDIENDRKVMEIRPEKLDVWQYEGDSLVKIGKLPIEAAYEPAFSPDDKKVVFVGIQSAQSDVYLYDTELEKLIRLTSNRFDERTPVFSKDGKSVYFLSDLAGKRWDGHFGSYAIFRYSLDSHSIQRISGYFGDIHSLIAINDSLLGFIGTHNGANNVMVFNTKDSTVYQLTNFPTDMKLISTDSDFSELGFSLMWNGRWSYFVVPVNEPDLKPVQLNEVAPNFVNLNEIKYESDKTYTTRFSVDWIQGYLEYVASMGLSGWMTIGLSDELGNHHIVIATDRYSGNTNFYFQYANLTHRADWYLSAFHYWDYGLIDYYTVYQERNMGVIAGVTYPFNKFSRIDADLTFRHPTRYTYIYDEDWGGFLLYDVKSYNSLELTASFVLDRALYSVWGPVAGDRGAIEAHTELLSPYRFSYFIVDYRKYYPLSLRNTWALRFMGGSTYGEHAPKFWIGGYNTLRGYYPYEFGGNSFGLFNFEWRVPFIDTLKFGFPFPLKFTGLRGVLFFDAGAVNIGKDFHPFSRDSLGRIVFGDIKADMGYGFRFYIAPGIALRFDFAKRFNLQSLYGHTMYYFSIDWDY